MAIVVKVTTPFFFSENEPYMIVLFVKEFKNKFKTAALSNPRYVVVYDMQKIYPELSVFAAKERFIEEMRIGHSEELNLHDFAVSDLTNNKYSSVISRNGKEQFFRIGCYDNFDEHKTAVKILDLFVKHRVLTLET